MGLFTAKPEPVPTQRIIHEIAGNFILDKDFAVKGESEGWLVYTGYYRLNDVVYLTYSFKE